MVSKQELAIGTIIYEDFVVEDILGKGGFGITYLVTHKENRKRLALKEYFPFQLAMRQKDSLIVIVEDKDVDLYEKGKQRFVREAAVLKEFQYLEGIVKVWDFFEAHNTAYIVMDYIDGVTLKEYVSCHGGMEYDELLSLLSPVLKSLAILHRHSVIHRDISPDNMMLGMDNHMYLIDFGSAKEMEYGKTATVLLKAGYAPPEQYLHDGELGAWTDIYAVCATIYMALSGKVPVDAVARLQGKELPSLQESRIELEGWKWNALKKGLEMRAAERFRSMEELYVALTVAPTKEDIPTMVQDIAPDIQVKLQEINGEKQTKVSRRHLPLTWIVGLLFVAVLGVLLYSGVVGTSIFDLRTVKDKELSVVTENSTESETRRENTTEERELTVCKMPNLVGFTEIEAKRKLRQVDGSIQIKIEKQYDTSVAKGLVISQSVEPDTRYNEGRIEEIILTISNGVEPVTEQSKTEKVKKSDSYEVESDGNEPEDFYLD